MSKQNYCQTKAAPPGSNFYYSTLFYPALVRQSLFAVHALFVETRDIARECSDPGVARIKLSWWHEEIQRVYNNQARHPVSKALTKLLTDIPVEEDKFHLLVNYHEKKLDNLQFETFDQLNNFLLSGPGMIWEMIAEICEFNDHKSVVNASELGCLSGLFDIIQNIHLDITQGFFLLPQQELVAAGLTYADFTNNNNENNFNDFFAIQFQRIIRKLDMNFSDFPEQDRSSLLCCLIMNRLILNTCKEIEKDKFQLRQHIVSLTPVRKLWIAWRTRHG